MYSVSFQSQSNELKCKINGTLIHKMPPYTIARRCHSLFVPVLGNKPTIKLVKNSIDGNHNAFDAIEMSQIRNATQL